VQSFRTRLSERRRQFILLSGQIERQLREAYDRKFRAGLATQSSLAAKLGVNRSAVHRRLMGHTNMTIETLSDMVWALDHAIKIEIYDPSVNQSIRSNQGTQMVAPPRQPTGLSSSGGPVAVPAGLEQIPGLMDALRGRTGSPVPAAP
jgi:hypothetical protein